MWFPRPANPADIELLNQETDFSRELLFDYLHDPEAVEWKDKVGVTTPADGSAKATARLLKSRGLVFKTDIGQRTSDKAVLRSHLQHLSSLASGLKLWHPEKRWFMMLAGEEWLPVSVCPQLTTIRAIDSLEERLAWWSRMIVMGLKLSEEHGIGLDLNPSNFAFHEPASARLYYLDDEFYAQHNCFDIAEAVVARIPEDPTVQPSMWEHWGQQLKERVSPFCREHNSWRLFLDGIRSYPLIPALEKQRNALLQGLRGASFPSGAPALKKESPQLKKTCIFSDVHANLPAFEAVLKQAQALQVDSYLFLGDIVSYGPFPHQCIERLAELDNCLFIRGNHDHTSATGIPEDGSNRIAREVDMWTHQQLTQDERDWILAMPVEHLSPPWQIVHGAPQDPHRFYAYVYELTYGDNLSFMERQGFSVCFYGHTHVQFVYRRQANGQDEKKKPELLSLFQSQEHLLINPGSVGQPRDGDPRAAFAMWDRVENSVSFHRTPYPVRTTIEWIKKEGLPEDLIYRLEYGR